MAFKEINQSVYDALVIAFRDVPANASRAARQAGIDRRTAGLAWERGWPQRGWPAIKLVLADERSQAVKAAKEAQDIEREAREAERERRRKDADERDKQEEDLIKLSRSTTMGAIMALAHQRNALVQLASIASQGITDLAAEWKADPSKIRPERFLDIASKYARAVKAVDEGARLAIVAERLRTGKIHPEESREAEMGLGEAMETIALAHEAAERAKANGLVVLEGGKAEKKAAG